MRNQLQDYNYTASKSTEKESLHINASLQNKHRDYGLQTSSNQSLETNQQLRGDDLSWQLNFNYNRKLNNNLLWTNTLGYFNQSNNESLVTNPDFLFWLFPDSLSMNYLFSKADIKLQYLSLKTSLFLNNKKMTHEVSVTYSREKHIFLSELQTKDLNDDKQETPFSNNSKLQNPYLQIQYKGGLRLSDKYRLNMSIANEPHFFSYRLAAITQKVSNLFYNYTMGISAKTRATNLSLSIGMKKQASDLNLFFPDFVQTGFHDLQSGRMDTYGVKSAYLQASYSLISLKLGWISFFLLNVSHDKSDFIRNVETKGIATTNSFFYFPNSTNQVFFVFNSRKTLGELPFSLNSNLTYNRRSIYDGFNGIINKSDFQFLSLNTGVKSQFKSFLNLDYNFSLLYSRNKIKSPSPFSNSSYIFLNKLNLYLTSQKIFNSTITLNNMISNKGTFDGYFLDLTLNRKFWNQKLLVSGKLRNILNKNFIDNTVITQFYKQINRVEIRGVEFFFSVRYEIR